MVPTAAQRLQKVLTYTKLNALEFSKAIGLSQPTMLYYISQGRNNISPRLAKSITAVFPDISFEWLTTGQGQLTTHRPTDPVHHKLKALEAEVQSLKGQNNGLNEFLQKLK